MSSFINPRPFSLSLDVAAAAAMSVTVGGRDVPWVSTSDSHFTLAMIARRSCNLVEKLVVGNPEKHLQFLRRPRCTTYHHQQRPHLPTLALVVEPSDGNPSSGENVSDFVNRIEKSWMISKQPRPVSCACCEASGRVECLWCKGTGFFILGDSILCEVPSRNTNCRICYGQGLVSCDSCKGTGYRAKWLEQPKVKKDLE